MKPETKYTKSGEINIAYQVFGSGTIDLVYIPGWVSNIDLMWACPELVDFLVELGKMARVILFDKRGTGLSDRVVDFSTLDERMDDIRAVMDTVNSKKAVLFGHSEGGSVSALFAATYPNRTISLITFGIFAKRMRAPNYPWAPSTEERQFELVAYEELKELKKQQHKPYEALAFYEKYESLKDSLFALEKSKQIAYIEFENELEKKNNELSKLEAHEKASKIINLILILGIVILSVAGYIIYSVSKQRLKKSKQLALKTKEYLESEQALIQKELENSELKRQELRQQLDFKNRELTSYALNFIKKNEVVQELQLIINKLKESSVINKDKLITDLKKIIKKNLSIDRDWDDFSRFFDDVHQGFYSNLKLNHNSLTVNDLKLCSLIRLNLNTKETASILGISPESAKTARYRLRQKLGIDAKQDIANYLVNLEFEPNSK
ncbi:alpha/beta fold hydrolase [Flavobacterium sp. HNIBRBA15423]|uniref:alpha/beta fold hydrolase n=1 Tax=Flavobacterium sp. HNIBRBA15423 TaxID=3458683 RepID=UPI0040444EAF